MKTVVGISLPWVRIPPSPPELMKNNLITIGGAVVFRESRGKQLFLVTKQAEDTDWEIPKVTARRGESSIRSVLRMTGEQAGMSTKVLEEAYRSTGTAFVNGKSVPQRFFYYLMVQKAGGEVFGFQDFKWLELAKAKKLVVTKKEKTVFDNTKDVLKTWLKTHKI